jgi:kynurenine formamidase
MMIDLTRNIPKAMPFFPFDEAFDVEWSEFPGLPYVHISSFKVCSHMGTHIDAPCHFIPDGRRIHNVDVSRFVGKGYLIDLSDEKRDLITLDDVQKMTIEPGRIILLYTGLVHTIGTAQNWMRRAHMQNS